MTPTAILESALYVNDLDAAEAFYRDILGLDLLSKVPDRHAFFRCGQSVLLLFNAEATRQPPEPGKLPVPPHGTVGQGHLCFSANADEIERWAETLAAEGVAVESDFIWPNGGRSIYFRDPSGNSIEFAEPRIWGL